MSCFLASPVQQLSWHYRDRYDVFLSSPRKAWNGIHNFNFCNDDSKYKCVLVYHYSHMNGWQTCCWLLHRMNPVWSHAISHGIRICGIIYLGIITLHEILTHWGRDQMAAIFQTIFSDEFPWMKMNKFRLRFTWVCPKRQINNVPTLVQIMAWRWSCWYIYIMEFIGTHTLHVSKIPPRVLVNYVKNMTYC